MDQDLLWLRLDVHWLNEGGGAWGQGGHGGPHLLVGPDGHLRTRGSMRAELLVLGQ